MTLSLSNKQVYLKLQKGLKKGVWNSINIQKFTNLLIIKSTLWNSVFWGFFYNHSHFEQLCDRSNKMHYRLLFVRYIWAPSLFFGRLTGTATEETIWVLLFSNCVTDPNYAENSCIGDCYLWIHHLIKSVLENEI